MEPRTAAEEVTQGQVYPFSEVEQYIHDPTLSDEPGITEEQAIRTVEEAVDTTDVVRKGEARASFMLTAIGVVPIG